VVIHLVSVFYKFTLLSACVQLSIAPVFGFKYVLLGLVGARFGISCLKVCILGEECKCECLAIFFFLF